MMTIDEVSQYASNKGEFHDILVRNKLYVPSKESRACTLAWMFDVFRGDAWCPRQDEVGAVRQIPNPPKLDKLQRILRTSMTHTLGRPDLPVELKEAMKLTLRHLEKNPPDKLWLVNVIGMVEPQHEIFERAYVEPPKEKKSVAKMVADPLGMLQGLPTKPAKKTLRLPKEQSAADKMEKLMRKQADLDAQIRALREASAPLEEKKQGRSPSPSKRKRMETSSMAKRVEQRHHKVPQGQPKPENEEMN